MSDREIIRDIAQYTLEMFPSRRRPSDTVLTFYAALNSRLRDRKQRYLPYWQEHIDSSRRMILNTAQGFRGNALIVGLGNATDIPLAELVTQFDSITVVDMDLSSVHNVLITLPEQLQRKFHVIIDDLTGILAAYDERIADPASAGNLTVFLKVATEALKDAKPRPFTLGQKYSLVISSLVSTQLASTIDSFTRACIRFSFGVEVPESATDARPYFEQLTRLSRDLTSDHLDFLAASALPIGRVYLSDTVSELILERQPGTQTINPVSQPMPIVDSGSFMSNLKRHFNVLKHENWVWYREPPEYAVNVPTRGSAFSVEALSLIKK